MEQRDLRGLRPPGWVVGKKAAVNFRTRRSDLATVYVAYRG